MKAAVGLKYSQLIKNGGKLPTVAFTVKISSMFSFLSKIFPDKNLSRAERIVSAVNRLETEKEKLTNEKLLKEASELRKKIQEEGDGGLNRFLSEVFALVREAAKRTLNQRHYDVQIMGGVVLHEGKIAEMITGEGKTLAATLPLSLNAMLGKGVHIVTVNEYLAKRDTVWMGQIYNALGLSVACLIHEGALIYDPKFESPEIDEERDTFGSFKVVEKFLRPIKRKEAYEADITYGTNHEFGFDYLRDNLTANLDDRVQRSHFYAIIDEVDSILIDEARTPLIIAQPDRESSEHYKTFAQIVRKLKTEEDYIVDEKMKSVNITEQGITKVESSLGIENIYSPENSRMVHFLQESLKAKELFKNDRDYVIKSGEIVIVDQFTGRLMHGRRYSSGLHQAIEAKEGVLVREENRTYAQVTIQNYFRMYQKIAGMTGTAETSAEEFHKVYNLDVVTMPTNKPLARKNLSDVIYKTKDAKYKAIARDVKERNKKGQPVLLGTTSITNNETISSFLNKEEISHEILNAKNHEREGEIIAQAGRVGAVTVATNMAGRGVDIVLGGNPPVPEEAKKVLELGGLHVIGTERHEARRIDNQLRGRAGRQGDPGSSQFFLSLEDDLVRIFRGERISNLMERFNLPEDTPIESSLVSRAVNQAQQKVEGMNFDARKHLLDFDDVLNKQRMVFYSKRFKVLVAGEENKIIPLMEEMILAYKKKIISRLARAEKEKIAGAEESNEIKALRELISDLEEKTNNLPKNIEPIRARVMSEQLVRILDFLWVDHLEALDSTREYVRMRAYAQKEPIVEYRREAKILFENLAQNFNELTIKSILPIFEVGIERLEAHQAQKSSPEPPPRFKKIGRNDPCWCGSGKKYKKCHGK